MKFLKPGWHQKIFLKKVGALPYNNLAIISFKMEDFSALGTQIIEVKPKLRVFWM